MTLCLLLAFTSRSSFEAAAGPALLREEFGGYVRDIGLRKPMQAHGFQIQSADPLPNALGPHGFARLRTEGDTGLTVDLTPDVPLRAFGAYFCGQQFGEHVRVFVRKTNGKETWIDLPDRPGFFGVIMPDAEIRNIQFRSRTKDGFSFSGAVFTMDDVVLSRA